MISPEYKFQITQLHGRQSWGNHGWKALPQVLNLMLQYRLRHPQVLDYGAGERTLELTARWALPHAKVRSYDPGIPGFDELPQGMWDIVVCTDVLEHIEPQYLEATLDHIRACCKHAAYFIIAVSKAKTILPDGRNAHLIIKPADWWIMQLKKRWKEIEPAPGKNCVVIARV
jgi:hypothetical protein